ncbi:DUF1521 domain-containing protein [Algiphilus sp. W345]|uniref:DUF1521 domain-containing protein n=1 Tax=Banduia mediterranea TaxID=3075609 RepID=A0ABU2WK22_9GAMM|nr:DUF1521 domain-containing protein [Algiphilus sp. W345]MDT0498229.1 DUF1521 domain-containing protein [Algiphilus sp. W345]
MTAMGNMLFGGLSETRFQGAMARTLDTPVGGPSEARVAGALEMLNPSQMSGGERKTLLTMARALSADGDISPSDADALIAAMREFSTNGIGAFSDSWPFSGMDLRQAPGSALFNGMLGELLGNSTGELGSLLRDYRFLSTVDSLLEQTSTTPWMAALDSAFGNADLSRLSGAERMELVGMVATAASDGDISWPEASTIMAALDKSLGNSGPSVHPMPVPAPAQSEWTVSETGNGRATIDLGNYTLDINEHSSEIVLTNKDTGERSRIWGDPHFDTNGDGRTDVDFWGTISLNLEDGTKITIDTTPYARNEAMTLSSKLTITKGDQAIVVDGLDQNSIGDMSITQSDDGRVLDTFTGDGMNLYENSQGEGWMVRDGLWMREVTQTDMNKTKDMGSDFSPIEALQAMSLSFSSGLLMGMLSSMFIDPSR